MPLGFALRRSRHAAACGLFILGFTAVPRAQAADLAGVRLTVTRTEAASCPDTYRLSAELAQRAGPRPPPPGEPLLVVVELSGNGTEYAAHLRVSGRKQGERTLRAPGPSCDSLREALLVALLVLLDEDRAPPEEGAVPAPAPAAAPPAASAALPAPTAEPPQAAPQRMEIVPDQHPKNQGRGALPVSLWLSVGGGFTHGIPLDASGALLLDLALRAGAFEVSAGALWAPEKRVPTPPGYITVSTAGERLRGCYGWSPRGKPGPRVLGCAVGLIASLNGNGHQLVGGHGVEQPWWLLGAAAEATLPITPRIDAGISASALAPLHRQQFAVDGAGIPYRADDVVALFTARLEARIF